MFVMYYIYGVSVPSLLIESTEKICQYQNNEALQCKILGAIAIASLHIANLPSNTVTCTVYSGVVESNHKNALIRIACN